MNAHLNLRQDITHNSKHSFLNRTRISNSRIRILIIADMTFCCLHLRLLQAWPIVCIQAAFKALLELRLLIKRLKSSLNTRLTLMLKVGIDTD